MLPIEDAERILDQIRSENNRFASQRQQAYLSIRRELEEQLRSLFIKKGGKPQLMYPHYFVLGKCSWVLAWYLEGQEIHLPLKDFCPSQISFTYGDSFPTMRYSDGKPYRKQVYTLSELPQLIFDYGLPQEWNPAGEKGPERYIEAQVWSPIPLECINV